MVNFSKIMNAYIDQKYISTTMIFRSHRQIVQKSEFVIVYAFEVKRKTQKTLQKSGQIRHFVSKADIQKKKKKKLLFKYLI